MSTVTAPYKSAAGGLVAAGWHLTPLPAAAKYPPLEGLTGAHHREATEEEMLQDFVERQGDGNVGIVLPRTLIGLDFDAYKDEAIKSRLEQRFGALPETVGVTSQEDVQQGATLFFSVPEGTEFISGIGALDIIQSTHRYSVAPPSIHPSGREYRWVTASGATLPWVPSPEEAARLPQDWLTGLARPETPREALEAPQEPLGASQRAAAPCAAMRTAVGRQIARINGTQRHASLVGAAWNLTMMAREGHRGLETARGQYERAWIGRFSSIEATKRPLEFEIASAFRSAEVKSASKQPTGAQCACGTRKNREFTPKSGIVSGRMWRM